MLGLRILCVCGSRRGVWKVTWRGGKRASTHSVTQVFSHHVGNATPCQLSESPGQWGLG